MRLIMDKQWELAEEEATKEHEMGNASLERTGRIPSANWSKKCCSCISKGVLCVGWLGRKQILSRLKMQSKKRM